MTDFLTTTKELLEKATKGPWKSTESGESAILGANGRQVGRCYKSADLSRTQPSDNAALIVHLVNNAPLFLELAECLQHIEEYWNGSRTDGAMEDALEEIQYSARTILSKLNGAAS